MTTITAANRAPTAPASALRIVRPPKLTHAPAGLFVAARTDMCGADAPMGVYTASSVTRTKPTFGTDGARYAALFNGTSDGLQSPLAYTGSATVAIVARMRTMAGSKALVTGGITIQANSAGTGFIAVATGLAGSAVNPLSTGLTGWHVFIASSRVSGGNQTLVLDIDSSLGSPITISAAPSLTSLTVANKVGSVDPAAMNVAAVAWWNTGLEPAQRATTIAELNAHFS